MPLQECDLQLSQRNLEQNSHGTSDFPCAGYEEFYSADAQSELPWHTHPDMEFILLTKGEMLVRVPEREYHLKANDGIWFNTGIPHYAKAEPSCALHSMVFSTDLLVGDSEAIARKYILPLTQCSALSSVFFSSQSDSALLEQFSHAFDALKQDQCGYELQVRNALSSIILKICTQNGGLLSKPSDGPDNDTLRIRTMLGYIHQNTDHSITLKELADTVSISERECLRCFQRVLHISPIQYALQYRMMQSAEALLQNRNQSISETAMAYGFDSSSYYNRLFHRCYQCSPKEYRSRQSGR